MENHYLASRPLFGKSKLLRLSNPWRAMAMPCSDEEDATHQKLAHKLLREWLGVLKFFIARDGAPPAVAGAVAHHGRSAPRPAFL